MRLAPLAATVALALPLATLAAKEPNFQEGQWETTIKVEMPGMPMAMPPFVTSTCITKKDMVPQTQQPGQDCKILKQEFKNDTVEWSIQCKDAKGNTTDGTGKITYKGEVYAGEMNVAMTGPDHPAMQMKYTMSGKRTGVCKAEPAK